MDNEVDKIIGKYVKYDQDDDLYYVSETHLEMLCMDIAAHTRHDTRSEWQPIEAAPQNAVDILLSINNFQGDVLIGRKYPKGWFDRNMRGIKNPTHWMPLPAAPIEPKEGA